MSKRKWEVQKEIHSQPEVPLENIAPVVYMVEQPRTQVIIIFHSLATMIGSGMDMRRKLGGSKMGP